MELRSKHLLAVAAMVVGLAACAEDVSDTVYFQRAQNYLADGDQRSALIELKNAIKKNPRNFAARLELGRLQFERYDYASAEKELNRVVESGDSVQRDGALPLLAQIWVASGNFDQVMSIEDAGLSPTTQGQISAARAIVALSQNAEQEAKDYIDSALELAPQAPYVRYVSAVVAVTFGDAATAQRELESLSQQEPVRADVWATLGDIAASGSNPESAPPYYAKAVNTNPQSAVYRLKQVFSLIRVREFDKAREQVEVLIERVPQDPRINYAMGIINYHDGAYNDALSNLLIAEPARYDSPGVLLYLGLTEAELGDYKAAYGYASDFYAVDPDNPLGRRFMARMWLQVGEFDKAEALIRGLLEDDPEDVQLLNLLANALVSQHRTDEALEVLTEVSRLQPDSTIAKARLGAGYLSAGKREEGLDLVREAIASSDEGGRADALLVMSQLDAGDNDAALESVESYIQRAPGQVEPLLLKARVALKLDDRPTAIAALNEALALEPANPAANHALASLALSEQDYDGVRQRYQAVLSERPDYLPTLMALAALQAMQQDQDAMVATLNKAMESNPHAIQPRVVLARFYLSNNQAEKVAGVFTGLEGGGERDAAVLRVKALAYLQQREFVAARDTLLLTIDLHDPDADDYRLLAQAYDGMGETRQVKEALLAAKELAPDDAELDLSLAKLAYATGDREEFDRYLAIAVEGLPDHPDVKQLQAAVARMDGDQKSALAILEQAYQSNPSDVTVMNLFNQYQRMEQSDKARELVQNWIQSHPETIVPRLALASQLQSQGKNREAIDQFEAVLKIDSNNVVALNNVAWMQRFDDNAKALTYARRAVELSQQAPTVQDTLAMVLSAGGQHSEAAAILDALLNDAPTSPALRFHRAQVAAAMNEKAQARSMLEAVLSEDSSFSEREEAEQFLQWLSTN